MKSNYGATKEEVASFAQCLNAAQNMVMAMADAEKLRGKTSFFGADRYIPAYKKAIEEISEFICILYSEKLVAVQEGDAFVMQAFREYMEQFRKYHPNWQDAYAFMDRFLDSKNSPIHSEIISKHRSWNNYLSMPAITRSKPAN